MLGHDAVEDVEGARYEDHERDARTLRGRPQPVHRPVGEPGTVVLGVEREAHAEHLGLNIRLKGARVFEDLPGVCALAKRPNVAVKASGMRSLSTQGYPFRDLHPHIRTLVDAFGPRRTFWGTDLTRMPCTYRECVTLFTEELPWLRGEDLEYVMGRGVCEWLGWPLPRA